MKILFIRPKPPDETIGLQHVMIVEPLELEILASLVGKENQVKIVDLILEKREASYFISDYQPDVVCVTGYITHTDVMIEICKIAKELNPKIVTIVGGVNIEKLPETIDHPMVDYRVVRNATIVFPQLIDFLQNKSDFPEAVLCVGEIMDESKLPQYRFDVPIPNRSFTKKYRSKYFYVFHDKVAIMKTSFGCPFPCSFCFCRKITGDNYNERPMEEVIEELKTIEENEIYIIDDNFLISEKRLRKFMILLKENNINKKYLIYGRADFIAAHPELMRELKDYGLRTVIVGFESFNDEELLSLKKKTLSITNEKAMRILNQNDIDCYASVIAMPNWEKEDFKRATKKMIELDIRFLNIQPLTPLEKTDIQFDDSKLVIDRKEFAKWDLAHITVQPDKLSINEFYNEILKMYVKVLFRPSNLIHHAKYSWRMQWNLLLGAYKVRKQYKSFINKKY